jgi:hypothetical protein
LCFVDLAKRPNRDADNDLVDGLGLTGVTGDSYSLVDMQSCAVPNNLAFVEYDLALITIPNVPLISANNISSRCVRQPAGPCSSSMD